MGNSSQGFVLPNQVQGVKEGAGISIAADGTISVNSQTVVGLMKMGQNITTATAAYNQYQWPTSPGLPGQTVRVKQTAGGVTELEWNEAIAWTAKGQLAVGTGVGTSTLLNVGTDGSILIADSSTASGLNYTSNYVSTTGAQGAANIPAGSTLQRPATPNLGAFRYNSNKDALEFWNGVAWETVASDPNYDFVQKTSNTGSAILPSGTTAQRDTSPLAGFFRFNDDNDGVEFYDGTTWQRIPSSPTGSFVAQTVPNAGTPSAAIPSGTTAQRQTFPVPGYLRYNTDLNALEVWDGTNWNNTSDEVDTFSAGTTGLTPAVPTKGDVVLGGTLGIANGGTSATTAVQALNNLLPVQGGNNGFYLVTNGTIPSWQAPPSMVNTFSAGVTGFNPSVATSGDVVLTGVLNILSGGTGATNRPQAINNLLPAQAGQGGRYLSTDGANVGWSGITGVVSSFSAGSTGFNPAVNTTGAIVLGGVLNISSGGTNASSRNDALNNLLPAQGGQTGKILTTDGNNASWQPAGGVPTGVTQIIAGTGITVSPITGVGAVTVNATSPAPDFYTAFVPGFFAADLPLFPGFILPTTLVVPAGYVDFLIFVSVVCQVSGDTTTFGYTGATVDSFVVTTGVPLTYSTTQWTKDSNVNFTKQQLSTTASFSGSVTTSYSFTSRMSKDAPLGGTAAVVAAGDYTITVAAFKP